MATNALYTLGKSRLGQSPLAVVSLIVVHPISGVAVTTMTLTLSGAADVTGPDGSFVVGP